MNEALFYYLNNLAGKSIFLDKTVIFFGTYLAYILAIATIFIFIKNRNLKFLLLVSLSVFLSRVVFAETIRFFYKVSRPFVNNPNVHQLIFHETSSSFPSGHATAFFALATAVYLFSYFDDLLEEDRKTYKKWGIVFFISSILMGIARIIAGVHWPLDILAGAIIGIFSAFFICKIFKIIYNKS